MTRRRHTHYYTAYERQLLAKLEKCTRGSLAATVIEMNRAANNWRRLYDRLRKRNGRIWDERTGKWVWVLRAP